MVRKWDLVRVPVDLLEPARKRKAKTGKHLYLAVFDEMIEQQTLKSFKQPKKKYEPQEDFWRWTK